MAQSESAARGCPARLQSTHLDEAGDARGLARSAKVGAAAGNQKDDPAIEHVVTGTNHVCDDLPGRHLQSDRPGPQTFCGKYQARQTVSCLSHTTPINRNPENTRDLSPCNSRNTTFSLVQGGARLLYLNVNRVALVMYCNHCVHVTVRTPYPRSRMPSASPG